MGCSSSKQVAQRPDAFPEVIRGQRAQEAVTMRLQPEGMKGKVKDLAKGQKGSTWVKVGSHKRYRIYSEIIDFGKSGYRRHHITGANSPAKYCYFERKFDPYLKSHRYQCKAYDDSRTLFTVARDGDHHLIVQIRSSYDPSDSSWTGRAGNEAEGVFRLNYNNGALDYVMPGGGKVNCGKITTDKPKIVRGVDLIMCAALASIMGEIKEMNGLLKLAKVASLFAPPPAKGAAGVAMRGVTHFAFSESNARPQARNPEQLAFNAFGDVANGVADGRGFTDSAYASANNSIASSREVSRNRAKGKGPQQFQGDNRGRSQSRGRQPASRSASRR